MAMKKLSLKEEELKKNIIGKLSRHFGKTLEDATPLMVYKACALTARDDIMDKWTASHKYVKEHGNKKLYYLSFEFLMGRLLTTNILNLLKTKEYTDVLANMGYSLGDIAEEENDAGLGNGGLGRLSACFIDSLTTLDYPAYGCTIRYEYGLFKQKIVDGYQTELPDPWLEDGNIWEIARPEEAVVVRFGGRVNEHWENGKIRITYDGSNVISALPYDVPLVGYDSNIVNKLRLWSAKSLDTMDMSKFNVGNYLGAVESKQLAEVISKVLYPEDNLDEGKELRLKQEYFLVSATLQWILREFEDRNGDEWRLLPEKVVIHINDTHPTLAIPEMMRLLMDEHGVGWDDAWEVVSHTFAYTNHTVMSEALEKWSIPMFKRILPRIYMIVDEMNKRLKTRLEAFYPGDIAKHNYMEILFDNQVHMANMCLASCFAVNGVSKLHTDILKHDIFADYYYMDKKRFHAITNGITFRRWLVDANPKLSALVTKSLGDDGWIKDTSRLEGLKAFCDDEEFIREFARIKYENKKALAEYIKEHNGIDVDPNSIFDVQAKRLHEYKRQLLNVLHIIAEYNMLRDSAKSSSTASGPPSPEGKAIDEYYPKTYIFAAKAAPGYARAKLIIKLINSVADVINNDLSIGGKIKVVFLENYSVSLAERVTIAADISEQISTAGKEASGTGNMKFMLNGAITIGTLDGANVEMRDEVGEDNIYIFGLKASEVSARARTDDSTEVKQIYMENSVLRRALEQLIDGTFSKGQSRQFADLYNTLLFGDYGKPDVYMVLRDFDSYQETQVKLQKLYQKQDEWYKKAIANTAMSGYFSSDRTIEEYNKRIWKLTRIH